MPTANENDTTAVLRGQMVDLEKDIAGLRRDNAELRRNIAALKTRLSKTIHGSRDRDRIAVTSPRYIAEGSFGTISAFALQPTVYKTTLLGDKANGLKLEHEFKIYRDLCVIIERNHGLLGSSEFISPRPRQVFDPFTRIVTTFDMTTTSCSSSWDVFERPTMAIELIPSVPSLVAKAYQSEFFSESLKGIAMDHEIRLLRLYLGRELPSHIQELQEGLRSDLALDPARYHRLADALEDIADLPSLRDVASGMGRVLSQLHWGVGVDGMDAELVLGGDGLHGLSCWVLDFNQCTRWLVSNPLEQMGTGTLTAGDYIGTTLTEGAKRLARRIANCEQYYPKPSQSIFPQFKVSYIGTTTELLHGCRPESASEAWRTEAAAIREASEAFIEEYEKVCQETLDRNAQTGDGRLVHSRKK